MNVYATVKPNTKHIIYMPIEFAYDVKMKVGKLPTVHIHKHTQSHTRINFKVHLYAREVGRGKRLKLRKIIR